MGRSATGKKGRKQFIKIVTIIVKKKKTSYIKVKMILFNGARER